MKKKQNEKARRSRQGQGDGLPFTIMCKIDSTWGRLIYHQLEQDSEK